jgi:hypothetical protein
VAIDKAFWTVDTISKAGSELKDSIKQKLPEMPDIKDLGRKTGLVKGS